MSNDEFRFTVSDSCRIPLRGWLLRLKLTGGDFDPSMLSPGTALKVIGPEAEEREVTVKGLSSTGGRQSRERVEAYGEFDIVIPESDAIVDGHEIGIGWTAVPA